MILEILWKYLLEREGSMKVWEIISKYERVSILSGAGVSVLSGIPCYSGDDGIYNNDYKGFPIGGILTASFYYNHQEIFFDYYFNILMKQMENKNPNFLHQFANELADIGKLELCITQNIDTLYEQSGLAKSKLCKIHGTYNRFICTSCGREVSIAGSNLSVCCKKTIKPKVVLYDENFDYHDFERYLVALQKSDLLIVMGTRLDIMAHKQNVAHFNGDIMLINNENIVLSIGNSIREWDHKLLDDFNKIKKEFN